MDREKISEYIREKKEFTIPALQKEFSLTYRQVYELVCVWRKNGFVKYENGLRFVCAEESRQPPASTVGDSGGSYTVSVVQSSGGRQETNENMRKLDGQSDNNTDEDDEPYDEEDEEEYAEKIRERRARLLNVLERFKKRRSEKKEHKNDDTDDDEEEEENPRITEEYLQEVSFCEDAFMLRVLRLISDLRMLTDLDDGTKLPKLENCDDDTVAEDYRIFAEERRAFLLLRLEYENDIVTTYYEGESLYRDKEVFSQRKLDYQVMLDIRHAFYRACAAAADADARLYNAPADCTAEQWEILNDDAFNACNNKNDIEADYVKSYEKFHRTEAGSEGVEEDLEYLTARDLRVRALKLCIERGSVDKEDIAQELDVLEMRAEECMWWMLLHGYAYRDETCINVELAELDAITCRTDLTHADLNARVASKRKKQ